MATGPVAAIDIGSNAIRLLVARGDARGGLQVVRSERAAVRLALPGAPGALSPSAVAAAIRALADLAAIARAAGCTAMRVVATSAVRDARDGPAFVQRALQETGIPIEVIAPEEEARLAFVAARARFDLAGGPWILMDLGGGSLEVARVEEGAVQAVESRSVGAVRLLAQAAQAAGTAGLRAVVERALASFELLSPGAKVAGLLACGGSIEALARLLAERHDDLQPAVVDVDALESLVDAMAATTPAGRMAEWGLGPDRADVIVPAGLVYTQAARQLGVRALHVPGWGVREGVCLTLLAARGSTL